MKSIKWEKVVGHAKHRTIVIVMAIGILLALLGIFSFSLGYDFGNDVAQREHRN